MTRGFAVLVAAVTLLAGIDDARAQGFDMREIMGGGSFFGLGSRSSSARREVVSFVSQYKPGTIYIDTAERRLYLVLAQGQALRYGIGVGRDGFRWSGVHRISAKKEWPGWTPPSQMLARRPDLPRHMAGGLDNPLGARAMYLGSTLYRIHGSNEPGWKFYLYLWVWLGLLADAAFGLPAWWLVRTRFRELALQRLSISKPTN